MKTSLASSWNSCFTEVVICCLSYKSKSPGVFCHVSLPLVDVQFGFSCGLELHSNEPNRAVEAPGTPQVLSQWDILGWINSLLLYHGLHLLLVSQTTAVFCCTLLWKEPSEATSILVVSKLLLLYLLTPCMSTYRNCCTMGKLPILLSS